MRRFGKFVVFLLLIAAFLPLHAQLAIGLTLNRQRYMIYEQIYACVTLRNDTGKPLFFGSRPEVTGFLLFDIRDSRDRLILPRKGVSIPTHGLYLAPGEVRRVVVPLQKYYDLSREGTYVIHAYVSHNKLEHEYRSNDRRLHVTAGAEIWRKVVGLPDRTGDGKESSVERIYSIYKMIGDREKYYFLRVEDDGKIYAMTRIGMVQAHMKFDAQVDMLSRIHLLMPVAPRIYHYMLFNADGTNLENSYWKTVSTVPGLFRNPETGKVERLGGERARYGIDFTDPLLHEGGVKASELLEPEEQKKPAKASGVVDLGDGLLPTKPADEE